MNRPKLIALILIVISSLPLAPPVHANAASNTQFEIRSVLCSADVSHPGVSQPLIPAGYLRFLGGSEGEFSDLPIWAEPCVKPQRPVAAPLLVADVPSGFLRFLGGGEGDPNALTPACAADPLSVDAIPEGFLAFFGGQEGDPDNLTPNCASSVPSGGDTS